MDPFMERHQMSRFLMHLHPHTDAWQRMSLDPI
jgi:hypothetical protein